MTEDTGRRGGIGSPGGSWTQVETSVPDGTEVSGVDRAPKSTAVQEAAARLGETCVDVTADTWLPKTPTEFIQDVEGNAHSQEVADAITDAMHHFQDTKRGWGLLAMDEAEMALERALAHLQALRVEIGAPACDRREGFSQ